MSAIRAISKRKRNVWLVALGATLLTIYGAYAASPPLAQQSILEYHAEVQRYLIPDEEIPSAITLRQISLRRCTANLRTGKARAALSSAILNSTISTVLTR